MSHFKLDDDLIREYQEESLDQLSAINADVQLFGSAGPAADEQLADRIFRSVQRIKVGAGFLDLAKIKELAQAAEVVFDLVRSGSALFNSDSTGTVLLAFDKLRELITDCRHGDLVDITESTAALSRLAEQHLSPDQKLSFDEKVMIAVPGSNCVLHTSAFGLEQGRRGGKAIYVVEFDLINDIQKQSTSPLQVLNKLMACGAILGSAFDFDSAGTLDDEPSSKLLLAILFATSMDKRSIAQLVDISPRNIQLVSASLKPTVVKPPGDLVASKLPSIRSRLRELVDSGVNFVTLDLASARMVDSAGLGLLISAHNSLKKAGGELTVVHASDDILDLFRTMRIHEHLTVSGN